MRRRAIAIIAAAALALAGCSEATPDASTNSGGQADINDIEIGMSDSLAPSIKVPEGETFTAPQSQVIWEGTGAPLQDNQPLLLDIYGVSLKDGRELINTYDGLPKSYLLAR